MPQPRVNKTPVIAGILGAVFVVVIYLVWPLYIKATQRASTKPRSVDRSVTLLESEKQTISLFEDAAPSVVYITSLAVERDLLSANLLELPRGTGSGFIWDKHGYIVTNFHVIQDAEAARVTLSDRTSHEARLVGVEPDKDIAVLKIEASTLNLKPLDFGTSRNLKVGQRVLAIGNPFGFDHTLTTGVISGLNREIKSVTERPILGVIQTDAAINPGNSGGPLLDTSGRLIGVNTAIVSPSGAYAGIGFAVPVDTVNRVVPQLIKYGKIKKPGLGIRVIESDMFRAYGVDGAVIADVLPGSPADLAGVTPAKRDNRGRFELGDVITSLNNQLIESADDLYKALDEKQPGESIILTLSNGKTVRTVSVTLGLLK
jgi:S1-C subfamily serine protease